MGAVRFSNPGSGSYTLPSPNIQRIWVSCIGGGGGGHGGIIFSPTFYDVYVGGGGGGWGYSSVPISSNVISYSVGSGGIGQVSSGGTSTCLGVSGFGGAGGSDTNITFPGGSLPEYAGGGFSSPAGTGQNGYPGCSSFSPSGYNKGRPGGAGGSSPTVCLFSDNFGISRTNNEILGNPNPDVLIGNIVSAYEACGPYAEISGPAEFQNQCFAGGGGNGNDGTGATVTGGLGSIFPINQTDFDGEGNVVGIPSTAIAGNGIYGGGGGYSTGGNFGSQIAVSNYIQGNGGDGIVYVSWIDLSVSKTTLRSNEPITVSYNSPVSSGSETVSYTNTGTSNITQTYTRTDSRGAQSSITFTILPAARIVSFNANPNPQTSGFDGIPNFDTILSWTTANATSASITNIGNVSTSGSFTVTDLPQSEAGVTSPATRTYTLTISDGFNTDTASVTVSVTNDNTPNNYSIPNQSNLEPNAFYVIDLGAITGIDMVTNVVGGVGVTVSKNNLQNYVSSITIVNNDSVQLRFRSDPFNQDPSGQPTAPRTLYIDIGPVRRFFTISTRAPDVNETFNLPNENNRVPYPDIDTISELSEPYIVSDTLLVDDIELQDPSGVEIKTSNSNIQIRKRIAGTLDWGPWQDVRGI